MLAFVLVVNLCAFFVDPKDRSYVYLCTGLGLLLVWAETWTLTLFNVSVVLGWAALVLWIQSAPTLPLKIIQSAPTLTLPLKIIGHWLTVYLTDVEWHIWNGVVVIVFDYACDGNAAIRFYESASRFVLAATGCPLISDLPIHDYVLQVLQCYVRSSVMYFMQLIDITWDMLHNRVLVLGFVLWNVVYAVHMHPPAFDVSGARAQGDG
jgi:hypothetical protein